jgi:hypothetical protein
VRLAIDDVLESKKYGKSDIPNYIKLSHLGISITFSVKEILLPNSRRPNHGGIYRSLFNFLSVLVRLPFCLDTKVCTTYIDKNTDTDLPELNVDIKLSHLVT